MSNSGGSYNGDSELQLESASRHGVADPPLAAGRLLTVV